MHTTILVTHIITITGSLILVMIATALSLLRNKRALIVARSSAVATALGVISGAVLLISSPLPSLCIELTAYLIGFTVFYRLTLTEPKLASRLQSR
jgi:hypothetical protein